MYEYEKGGPNYLIMFMISSSFQQLLKYLCSILISVLKDINLTLNLLTVCTFVLTYVGKYPRTYICFAVSYCKGKINHFNTATENRTIKQNRLEKVCCQNKLF
jgi:hypothetical protein